MILSLLPSNTPNKETYVGTANMAAHSLFQILTLFYIFEYVSSDIFVQLTLLHQAIGGYSASCTNASIKNCQFHQ
jgi:hypothetical protein